MAHLDIDALATVLAVARHASFTRAAGELNKTQAAVSAIVSRLEERLGDRVFERSRRGVALTPTGQVLADYSRRILLLENEVMTTLAGPDGGGRIRLGVPDDYLDCFVSGPVERFMMHHPGVEVEIHCDFSRTLEEMFTAGRLDLAIVTRGKRRRRGELLRREPQIWCAAPGMHPEREPTLPLALFPEVCRARPQIVRALDATGRPWRIAYSCSHLQGVLAAIARGRLLGVLPLSALTPALRPLGEECGLPALPELELALLLPKSLAAGVRQLADILRHSFHRRVPYSSGPSAAAAAANASSSAPNAAVSCANER